MNSTATSSFSKLCLYTLVAVYFLILVGGIVRATGSGMGCPDWPKCFGTWIPPTSVDQLPSNYKETFAEFRNQKNKKFARYLNALGFDTTANAILNDKSILIEADFNAVKTWIEYLNRIVGMVIGLLIIAVFIKGFQLRQIRSAFAWVSLATLLTVIIQGWFGSIVVSTNLTSWTITIHMLMAFVLVALLIWLWIASDQPPQYQTSKGVKILLLGCMLLLITQVLLGTEVRASIDRIAAQMPRDSWISGAGSDFLVHRSFSWLILIFHGILGYLILKTTGRNFLTLALFLLILLTVLSGAGMAYFSVPAFLQPVHLLIATVTFGAQVILFLRLNTKRASVLIN